MVIARGRVGGEDGEFLLLGTEFQFGKMKKFWKWMVMVMAVVTQQCECISHT